MEQYSSTIYKWSIWKWSKSFKKDFDPAKFVMHVVVCSVLCFFITIIAFIILEDLLWTSLDETLRIPCLHYLQNTFNCFAHNTKHSSAEVKGTWKVLFLIVQSSELCVTDFFVPQVFIKMSNLLFLQLHLWRYLGLRDLMIVNESLCNRALLQATLINYISIDYGKGSLDATWSVFIRSPTPTQRSNH